jgi:hypothetical protein
LASLAIAGDATFPANVAIGGPRTRLGVLERNADASAAWLALR